MFGTSQAGQSRDLAQRTLQVIAENGQTLGTAESLTAGLLAAAFGAVPGASTVFRGGIVAYCDQVKSELLGVPAALLVTQGAVSAPVARAMAVGAARALRAHYVLATTGEAGPSSGSGQPVGTVFIALSRHGLVDVRALHLQGSRNEIRGLAVRAALELLASSCGVLGGQDQGGPLGRSEQLFELGAQEGQLALGGDTTSNRPTVE